VREALAWTNVERAVVAWLASASGLPVFTETGPEAPVPRVRVQRTGGAENGLDRDVDVEVTVYAASRAGLWSACAAVETAMASLAANGTPYVDDVTTAFAFAADGDAARPARTALATFTLTVRPTR